MAVMRFEVIQGHHFLVSIKNPCAILVCE